MSKVSSTIAYDEQLIEDRKNGGVQREEQSAEIEASADHDTLMKLRHCKENLLAMSAQLADLSKVDPN